MPPKLKSLGGMPEDQVMYLPPAQGHSILRNYWVSHLFFQGAGSVRKPNLPVLGVKIR